MPTVAICAEQYLRERVSRKELSPQTARNVRSALTRFAYFAGETPLAQVDHRALESWLADRRNLTASTRRSQFSAVKTFLDWCLRRGLINRNPAADVLAPRLPRSVPRALPASDVTKLLAHCPDARGRAIIWTMVGMGLRCCEVANLQVGDWDRAAGVMVVQGKGGHERALPVPDLVSLAVERYLEEHPARVGPLFRSYQQPGRGLNADSISRLVARWMAEAGIKRLQRDGVSAHALRHTAASDVLDRCHDLRVVQAMLGHQHLSTTAIYLRRAALHQMRDAMGGRTYAPAV